MTSSWRREQGRRGGGGGGRGKGVGVGGAALDHSCDGQSSYNQRIKP